MLRPVLRHRWNLSPKEAMALQGELASRVAHTSLGAQPKLIAGADCAFSSDGKQIVAAWVVWDAVHRKQVEVVHVVRRVTFPYVPGLLSFREAPALIAAAMKLRLTPDVLMFDGQGVAHPRRFGIASHVGVVLDVPSIGCAKRRLCGEHREPGSERGALTALRDGDERIGTVLRTRQGLKPVFVSVGHRMTLEEAARLVLQCCTKYRLPEPTRLAHQCVTQLRETLD